MPNTPQLEAYFGQPGQQKPGCGFPVAHWLVMLHAGTGMITKMLAAPLRTHVMSGTAALHPELMLAAASRQGVDVRRICFIDALRWLQLASPGDELIPLVVNPHRPYRLEPRVRKRRPKQYPLMNPPRRQLKKEREGK